MKRILIAVGVLLAFAGIFFILRYSSYCDSDWVRTEFATLDEAKAANAFERGWLPPVLPDGTTKIVEVNDVEANFGEGSFIFPTESISAYLEAMQTAFGATVAEGTTGIRVQITLEATHWTIDLDQQAGLGKYAVELKR